MKEPPDKPIFRSIKTSLKSIIKNDDIQPIINNYVCNINKIIILTYQFIRLYFLYKYKNKEELPLLSKEFILYCIKTVSEPKTQRGQQKNKIKSVSVLPHQDNFITSHPEFNLSKFTQIHLEDYMNKVSDLEEIEREVGERAHEKTID